ncbi:Uncharacterised protein [Klebsiella michiganensis]|uniref:Uncharacterized protein n=1 Tax=Klebsiella michiganensis TaxID=1134687 RepID=A0A7H4PQB7_9ENTR|nr:Uncharacterised protein [Klebsiella michiganensis]
MRNARQALEERLQDESAFRATFDGVGRTAPADYLIDGVKVQSKFINGINNNLAHVLKHMEDYPDFTQDKAFYHIPKDTWQTIQDVIDGKPVEGMNERSLQAIREKVAEIENATGRSFADVVRPGDSNYKDVQWGKIDETLDKHDQELAEKNEVKKAEIVEEHQPSLNEAMRATAMGAAFGATFALGTGIYRKYQDGKNIFRGEFDTEDWPGRRAGYAERSSYRGRVRRGYLHPDKLRLNGSPLRQRISYRNQGGRKSYYVLSAW